MESTLNKIIENLEHYNKYFTKNEFYPVQKAYTTPHFIVLGVRVPGKTICLYIGRGHQYMGCYVEEKMPPAFLRLQDKFLDYVRRYLVGAKIGKIEFKRESGKEIFSFKYKTDHDQNEFSFGYTDREFFFFRREKDLVHCSWDNLICDHLDVRPPGSDFLKHKVFNEIGKYIQSEDLKSSGSIEQKKKEKFLVKKIDNIKKDLEVVKEWRVIEEKLLNEELDLEVEKLKYKSHTFNFIGIKNHWEKRDLIFKKIKKLKKGESLLKERLLESQDEYAKVQKGEFLVNVTKERPIQILWKEAHHKKSSIESNIDRKKDYIRISFRINNKVIFGDLGLNASGNDEIRNNAHKEHYWFHIENHPGAHCILKVDDFSSIQQDGIILIASILRDYSKLSITEIPIIFTQVKNIKGMKGVKGEVIVNKAKYLKCPYRDWKEIISIV